MDKFTAEVVNMIRLTSRMARENTVLSSETSPYPFQEALSLDRLERFILCIHILPHSRRQINLVTLPPPCLFPKLVPKENNSKQRQQNVSIYECSGVEGRQCCPPLDESEENVGEKAKVCVPWMQG